MDALLRTLVLCCAAVAAVTASCSETEFACHRRNGGNCLPLRWVCDGDNDCLDHSDENVCGSRRTCPDDYFACSSGRCIPEHWVCDGANDCRDHGSDEQHCGENRTSATTHHASLQASCSVEQFACEGYRAPHGCLPLHYVCDGDTSDCTDHSDERNCGSPRTCPDSWHACASGRCVPQSYVCDGGHDCPDGSDESQCASQRHCPNGEFACTSNRRSSGCIPMRWVCDGDSSDCVDGSDESQCGTPRTCPEEHFACDSGRCIPDSWVCDGANDCHDSGSDERNCNTASEIPPIASDHHCAADEFACRSNRRSSGCIPMRWVCDGDHGDCVDGSDERQCGSPRPCPADHFSCDNGRCVPNSWVCDGANDCHDSGSDERNCNTGTTTEVSQAHCSANEFACRSPRRSSGCIPRSWVCDGDRHDCYDNSDEENCAQHQCAADEFACRSPRRSSGCIPLRWVCDGDHGDCTDGSDERQCGSPRPCPAEHFSCDNGRCVPSSWVCDGTNDCHDSGSDERNCHASTTVAPTAHCSASEFACRSPRRDSGCIPRSWVCDGDHGDCYDGSDERNCGSSTTTVTPNAHCSSSQFACRSPRRSSGCIPRSWVCDGDHHDCYDNSDEANCGSSTTAGPTAHCSADEFACRSPRRDSGCIPRSWVCDGDHGDCFDSSDERNCGSSSTTSSPTAHCSAYQFACRSPRRDSGCIPRSWVCDGDHGDCYDGSDERNCATQHQCTENEFACTSNRRSNGCIPRSWVCDGDHSDCVDDSDEQNCGTSTTTEAVTVQHHCAPDEFACRSNRRSSGCIPRSWVCDGDHRDCVDDSDEQSCDQHHCAADEFACRSNRRDNGCIPRTWVCDGDHRDCVDDSDEQNCAEHQCAADEFACRSPRRSNGCIPRSWVCDGDRGDCYDDSDEQNCAQHQCAADEFACTSNRRSNGCIPRSWVCDGDHRDCVDDSDEHNCGDNGPTTISTPANQNHCAADEFACRSPRRSNGCIPRSWVCDGDRGDCNDDSDEQNCAQHQCAADEFACTSNRRSRGCIPRSWVCDGDHRDCVDDSDEHNCGDNGPTTISTPGSPASCSEEQLACASRRWRGGCVPLAAVCDGRAGDCDDGSDESNCGASRTCPTSWFACASGRCVPPAMVCDGSSQCPDGADERQCNNPGVDAAVTQTPEGRVAAGAAQGGAVKVELPSWLATDQDTHFALSLAPMLRARAPRDKLDAQMAVLRLFRELARN